MLPSLWNEPMISGENQLFEEFLKKNQPMNDFIQPTVIIFNHGLGGANNFL